MKAKQLFSTQELCEFLDLGYKVIQPQSVPEKLHDELFDRAASLFREHSELTDPLAKLNTVSDNLHVKVPQLRQILTCQELHSALESVVGRHYFRYPHSFIHLSGTYDQSYHKDSPLPWGTKGGMRSHRPNWAMAFYYPQATTIDMGSTEILPGTQYWNVDREGTGRTEGEDRLDASFDQAAMNRMSIAERDSCLANQVLDLDRRLEPQRLELPKGSIVLVHFDLFHRGTRRVATDPRFMFKFWYVRTTEPRRENVGKRIHYETSDERRQCVVDATAHWLGLGIESDSEAAATEGHEQEADCLATAYGMLRSNPAKLEADFCCGVEQLRRTATYALVNDPERALHVAHRFINSQRVGERQCSAFLIGETSLLANADFNLLSDTAVSDEDLDVRLTAINALGRAFRRNVGALEQSVCEDLVCALKRSLERASQRQSRSGLTVSAERESVYIALLNIVSELVESDPSSDLLSEIAELLSERVRTETDRYAKGTAIETLARLAQVGVHTAVQSSMDLLRQERWAT